MKIIISLLLLSQWLVGQEYSIYGSFGIGIHAVGSEKKDATLGDSQEDLKQTPALSDFFDSGFLTDVGFSIGLYNSENKDRRYGHFIVGMNYSMDAMESLFKGDLYEELLGSELKIKTLVPYVGYVRYIRGRQKKGHYYFVVGPAFTSYKGDFNRKVFTDETMNTKIRVKTSTTYDERTGIYIGGGFVSKLSDNLGLDIGSSYTIRDTRPLKNTHSLEDDTVFSDKINLEDNTIRITIGLILSF